MLVPAPTLWEHGNMFKEFREFVARGHVVDLAVAVVIGAAFGKIVTTLVEGVIMPPLGLLTGGLDFSSLFAVLDSSKGVPVSMADAKAKGVPVIAYGQLITDIINFTIVAFCIFLIVRQYNALRSSRAPAAEPTTKECPFCLSMIPRKALRCAYCTVELRGA